MKKLNKEKYSTDSGRQPYSKKRLCEFYDKYGVLFLAYRAVFGLLPSASRIVKSAHEIVHQIYDPQVTAETLNAKMRYKLNTNYQMAEERQRRVREIHATRDAATDEGPTKKKFKASANDCKETQQKEGGQLSKLSGNYSEEKISMIPENVKKQMKIRAINKRGSKLVEKKL